MTDPVDPGRLLTTLTTEHFTLHGSRAATTSESAARSSFLATVSGGDSALLRTFALTVLPTVSSAPAQMFLTNSFAIAVVTAVLGGSAVAFAVGVAIGAPLGIDVLAGVIAATVAVFLMLRFAMRHYGNAPQLGNPLFPSLASR